MRLRRVLRVIGAALGGVGVSAIVLILVVSTGHTTILIGSFTKDALVTLAASVCTLSTVVVLGSIDAGRGWSLLVNVGRVAAIGLGALLLSSLLLTSSVSVSPILLGDCATGYVVQERSFLLAGQGSVFRVDGVLATEVARTATDDGFKAFESRAYSVAHRAGSLIITYAKSPLLSGQTMDALGGEHDFSLPALSQNGCLDRAN